MAPPMPGVTLERQTPSSPIQLTISCRVCDQQLFLPFAGRTPPHEVITKKALEKGWERHGRSKWNCPLHTKQAISAARRAAATDKNLKPTEACMTNARAALADEQPQKVVPLRELTPQETRRAVVQLEEVFDDAAGKYAAGWSDQRVAEELDIPRANLTALRDQMFGPLQVNPELERAIELLAGLETETADAKAAIDAMAARIKKIEDGLRGATDRITRAGA